MHLLNFNDSAMANTNKKPFVLLEFSETNKGKYASVKHYETTDVLAEPFTERINISKDRGFAKSSPNYWLKTKDGAKWAKNALSGLFKTLEKNIYRADIRKNGIKTNSFLVEFSNNAEAVRVYFFNYYSWDTQHLISQNK